jgi:hypothetical protein
MPSGNSGYIFRAILKGGLADCGVTSLYFRIRIGPIAFYGPAYLLLKGGAYFPHVMNCGNQFGARGKKPVPDIRDGTPDQGPGGFPHDDAMP